MAQTDDARTILGPLTTTYTPVPSCTIAVEQCQTCSVAWQAQACWSSSISGGVNFGAEDFTGCWPPRASFVPTPALPLAGWGFYSPGLICPSGFTSACSATGGGVSGWPVQFGLLEKETAVGCCPSGYSCVNTAVQTCISYATSASFSMVSCESEGTSGNAFLFSVPTTVSSSAISTYSIFAPLIQINFQVSDLTSSTPSPTSSASSTSPTNTNTSTPTPSSISTGEKAGIGVAVALGIIAVACLAFYIVWKRKKQAYGPAGQGSPTTSHLYELGAANKGPYATSELPQMDERLELEPGQGSLHGERHVAELQ